MHTITLFGGGPAFGLPEISPFATKTEIHLKMAGLPYTKERARPEASPKGQLPFIKDGEALIADSTFIRAHIEKTYGFNFDAGLDARQRAEAWAIERMLENHFNFASGYTRFLLPENFAKGPGHWFDGAPEAMREGLRRELLGAVTATFKATGIARHAPQEAIELGDRSLSVLSVLLGGQDLPDERPADRRRCFRLRVPRRNPDAVLRFTFAPPRRELRQSGRLHSPSDGAVFSGASLGVKRKGPSLRSG